MGNNVMTDISKGDKTGYFNRQQLDMAAWPELREKFTDIVKTIMPNGAVNAQLKWEVFTISSLAAGCRHCQAHGAYGLYLKDVAVARIRSIWRFEASDYFDNAEKAAYRLARDAAQVPNAVGPEHFTELREYYSDRAIVELLAVISAAGWLNRWNDSIAVVTDQQSMDWAEANLSDLGWTGDKHRGEKNEQRKGHPLAMGVIPKE